MTESLEKLDDIFERHDTDKKPSFHNYTRQYESLLSEFRKRPIRYLEIGVYSGGSLKAMREALHPDSVIVGLDINPSCAKYHDAENGIHVEIGDGTDASFLNRILQKYGPFDFILDDGSHTNRDVIVSFNHLFGSLKDGGLYLVEDTICFKSAPYCKQGYPNHLEYFSSLTPYLNQWRHDSTSGIKDNCIDPFKIQKKAANPIEAGVDRIEFGCSYVAIHKKVRQHWL